MASADQSCRRACGFTLVELLVVIAVIAILASLLLPALGRAKRRTQTVVCLNNLKQLQTCWHSYAMDHYDVLVPNNSIMGIDTNGADGSLAVGLSWCLATPDDMNVQNGMLWDYNMSLGIYHCPVDLSTLTDPSGASGTLRTRSYNMSQSVNGYPEFNSITLNYIPSFKKLTDIQNPSPVNCFVFIDENEYTLLDSQFGMPTDSMQESQSWWDMPADRHFQGANLSFADGHVEHWRWDYPKVLIDWVQPVAPEEINDWLRLKAAVKQQMN